MPRSNEAVEALLNEYAELLAISGGDAFRVRTYEKAARAVGGYHTEVAGLDLKGLLEIPNVGKSTGEKILEYFRTGSIRALEELRAKVPAGVREMISIPTLGPKRAMVLFSDFKISSIDQLAKAIEAGALRGVRGFGEKTEENILRGIRLMQQSGHRALISTAMELADDIVGELSELKGVRRCAYAGSLRRMAETIGDVDVLAVSSRPGPVMDAFVALPVVERVVAHGDTKTSIQTTAGLQVDLRVVPPGVWGAALQYFTGSKAHNIRTREIAVRKGLKLSEYGLFNAKTDDLIVAETEEEVYERLGLQWVPPTLREDRGEIEAAQRGELPDVIQQRQIKGDLHTHTNLTDGLATLEQMLEAAAGLNYSYYAVTDHAPNLYMQRMTDEKMLAQRDRVRRLAAKYPKMVLLHGTELNIDAKGEVDWGPEFLDGFDVRVASVHSEFNQPKEDMTRRVVRACENPHVNIIGHLTTRLIGKRPPVDLDLDEVFAAAARTGTALEVNSYPDRLDLRDEHIMWAKRHGVKFAIDTDSHSTIHLGFLRYGVGTAQRGWLTKDDVINAWPLPKLRTFLKKGRS
jgi:DNA polymerase (family 10)